MLLTDELKEKLTDFYKKGRKITLLTGAGLSADSGIPTFRDFDGYWTAGSVNYMPEELGTYKMYREQPLEVWKWFLYRATICRAASPNTGHYAIKDLEDIFEGRFRLITQNVDGLHQKAGSTAERTYLIHGTLEKTRCGNECSKNFYPFPDIQIKRGEELTPGQVTLLKCPDCGGYLRPHVLWFDERYNEKYYRLDSSLRTAKETGLLIIVGTAGATNLPRLITETALSRMCTVININPNSNYFSDLAEKKKNGYVLQAKSSEALPELVDFFRGHIDLL
jgi:NAD-dependent deacetylase